MLDRCLLGFKKTSINVWNFCMSSNINVATNVGKKDYSSVNC